MDTVQVFFNNKGYGISVMLDTAPPPRAYASSPLPPPSPPPTEDRTYDDDEDSSSDEWRGKRGKGHKAKEVQMDVSSGSGGHPGPSKTCVGSPSDPVHTSVAGNRGS